MDIYVEYVIIDNMAIDCILLYLTCRICGVSVGRLRLFAGGALGTATALLLPVLPLHSWALFAFKIAAGLLIFFTGVPFKGIKRGINAAVVFFCLTFLMGGACIAVLALTASEIRAAITLDYVAPVPIGAVVLPVFFCGLAAVRLAGYVERRRSVVPFLRTVRILAGESSGELTGFIDTGNRLFDKNSVPVCVITYAGAVKLFGGEVLGMYLRASERDYISMQGADGSSTKLLSFYASRVDILNSGHIITHENVPFAILMRELRDTDPYDILLSPSLI